MLRFRRTRPIVELIPQLAWSHYVQIISLKSRNQREFYERAAAVRDGSRFLNGM